MRDEDLRKLAAAAAYLKRYLEEREWREEARLVRTERERECEVLAAFRKVTGWTDAEVLHYAVCDSYCTPICGMEEDACPEGQRLRESGR